MSDMSNFPFPVLWKTFWHFIDPDFIPVPTVDFFARVSPNKNIEKKKYFSRNRSFDGIIFPEQVDPAAGMSECAAAR